MKIVSSFTHSQVVLNLNVFLSSVKGVIAHFPQVDMIL